MKKISRIAMSAGIVCVLVALVWSGFSWDRIHNDIQKMNRKDYKSQQAVFDTASVQQIKTNLTDVAITFKTRTDTDHITVDYFQTKSDTFRVEKAGNAISISRKSPPPRHFICLLRCLGTQDTITVYIPANANYSYDVVANNAPVSLESATELQTQQIHINASNNSVRLQNITAHGSIKLESDNGSTYLSKVSTDDTLRVQSSNGSNELTSITAVSINATSDNGQTTLHKISTDQLTVNASNGSIDFSQLSAAHSTFVSDNGGVRGTMAGSKDDYRIKATSSNGTVHLNDTDYDGSYTSDNDKAAKSISIRSSNASVDIRFDQ